MPVEDYDRAATIYDPLLNPFLDGPRKEVSRLLVRRGVRNVLDLCCGTGRQAILLHGAGMRATGVDLSPAMLAVAHSKSPQDITYLQADATDTGLPDRSHDAVLLSFALHEMDEQLRLATLKEAARLCTPDGTIMVLDYRGPDTLAGQVMLQPIRLIERLAGREHHANFTHYMANGATLGLLERAGMTGTLEAVCFSGCAGIYSVSQITP